MRTRWIAVAIALFCISGLAQAAYNFDSDEQGWNQATVGYNGGTYETLYPNVDADWTSSYGVGSPDGSIYQSATTNWEGRAYWMGTDLTSAAASLGDLTGMSLQASVRSTANWKGRVATDTVYARWTIASQVGPSSTWNMWVSKAAYSIDLNAAEFGSGTDSDWRLKTIEMKAENFLPWWSTASMTFEEVLEQYTSVGLSILPTAAGSDAASNWNGASGTWGNGYTLLHYGAVATDGTATWGVDNVAAVPEPLSMLLFGGSVLGGLVIRRRRKL